MDYLTHIELPKMVLSKRRTWHSAGATRITAAAKMHASEIADIDRAAALIGISRNEFILSSAASAARAYVIQRGE